MAAMTRSGIADGGQRDKVDAIDKMVEQIGGHLHGQARFADAARAREGEQTDLLLQQQVLDGGYFVVAADERAARQEQVAGWRLGGVYLSRIAVGAKLRCRPRRAEEDRGDVGCIWGGTSTARVGCGHASP